MGSLLVAQVRVQANFFIMNHVPWVEHVSRFLQSTFTQEKRCARFEDLVVAPIGMQRDLLLQEFHPINRGFNFPFDTKTRYPFRRGYFEEDFVANLKL